MCRHMGGLCISLIATGSLAAILAPIAFGLFFGLAYPEIQLANRALKETNCTYIGREVNSEEDLYKYDNDFDDDNNSDDDDDDDDEIDGAYLASPTLTVRCYGVIGNASSPGGETNRTVFRTTNPKETFSGFLAISWLRSLPPLNSTIEVYYDPLDPTAPLFYTLDWSSNILIGVITGIILMFEPMIFVLLVIGGIIYTAYDYANRGYCSCPRISCNCACQCPRIKCKRKKPVAMTEFWEPPPELRFAHTPSSLARIDAEAAQRQQLEAKAGKKVKESSSSSSEESVQESKPPLDENSDPPSEVARAQHQTTYNV